MTSVAESVARARRLVDGQSFGAVADSPAALSHRQSTDNPATAQHNHRTATAPNQYRVRPCGRLMDSVGATIGLCGAISQPFKMS